MFINNNRKHIKTDLLNTGKQYPAGVPLPGMADEQDVADNSNLRLAEHRNNNALFLNI
jgi:hypothetical protein